MPYSEVNGHHHHINATGTSVLISIRVLIIDCCSERCSVAETEEQER